MESVKDWIKFLKCKKFSFRFKIANLVMGDDLRQALLSLYTARLYAESISDDRLKKAIKQYMSDAEKAVLGIKK